MNAQHQGLKQALRWWILLVDGFFRMDFVEFVEIDKGVGNTGAQVRVEIIFEKKHKNKWVGGWLVELYCGYISVSGDMFFLKKGGRWCQLLLQNVSYNEQNIGEL